MGWTKREFIEQAFDEIGLASYAYDLSNEDLSSALKKLDSMIASWTGKGVRIAYPLPSTPAASNLDQVTGVPPYANEAIYLNLAIRLGPSFGKIISPETKINAKSSYATMFNKLVTPVQERRMPSTLPLGAGNKSWGINGNPFFPGEQSGLTLNSDGEINL